MRSATVNTLVAVAFCVAIVATAHAAEAIIYVDAAATGGNDGSSWTDAYGSLQDALTAASEAARPLEIRVAQGVYTPIDPTSPFELLSGVALQGGYGGTTAVDPEICDPGRYKSVLSGDLNGNDEADSWDRPDNSVQVVLAIKTDSTAAIDGFTIAGASRVGMVVENGIATIRDCTFENNTLYGLETLTSSGLALANCRFIENGWAGMHGWDCRAVMTNCVFEGNGAGHASGNAAIHCPSHHALEANRRSSHLTLADCIFRENQEGGIEAAGTIDLTRCSFTGHHETAVFCYGTVTARQCTFIANEGNRAGAIRCMADFTLSDVEFDCTLHDCEFIGNTAPNRGGGGAICTEGSALTATRCLFVGNTGSELGAGAISTSAKVLRLSHCTFTGNMAHGSRMGGGRMRAGAVASGALVTRISNCTFSDNRGKPNTLDHKMVWASSSRATLTQCIVWDGADPFEGMVSATYSDVQGGYEGEGNIDADPDFVDPGYWDDNAPDDQEDDVYVAGDYHLKSQAGHWDQESESWIFDKVTSPCIDLGDPNGPLGSEPFPNGGFVNLGAYGGTSQASRSYFGAPVCKNQLAGDINGDCIVDDLDLDILMSHWLMPDIGKVNVPPSIAVISPEDGAELTSATPTVLRAEASDPDGTIIGVYYYAICRDNGTFMSTGVALDPMDNWLWQVNLSHTGIYAVWAEAIDDDGARTVSPAITVTLHPTTEDQ